MSSGSLLPEYGEWNWDSESKSSAKGFTTFEFIVASLTTMNVLSFVKPTCSIKLQKRPVAISSRPMP